MIAAVNSGDVILQLTSRGRGITTGRPGLPRTFPTELLRCRLWSADAHVTSWYPVRVLLYSHHSPPLLIGTLHHAFFFFFSCPLACTSKLPVTKFCTRCSKIPEHHDTFLMDWDINSRLCHHVTYNNNFFSCYSGWNCLSPFRKRVKFDVFTSNSSHLVTNHCKGLLTIKITTLRICVYGFPGQNGGLSKLTRCLSVVGCHFGQGRSTHLQIALRIFFNFTTSNNL